MEWCSSRSSLPRSATTGRTSGDRPSSAEGRLPVTLTRADVTDLLDVIRTRGRRHARGRAPAPAEVDRRDVGEVAGAFVRSNPGACAVLTWENARAATSELAQLSAVDVARPVGTSLSVPNGFQAAQHRLSSLLRHTRRWLSCVEGGCDPTAPSTSWRATRCPRRSCGSTWLCPRSLAARLHLAPFSDRRAVRAGPALSVLAAGVDAPHDRRGRHPVDDD
jgi:hypothetical protein